ncbi:probable G-protein coupled receptor frpr-1 [Paramacrobiotus metropolitanus]|uniref:probable G-protein coupled receptor frpr-1 n=1 Tax=Paramacrobiotus metropolitanus TaxID=2943436 RepID=UPI002445EDE2|nr:probable G-protein coupled receptor frpr-1 [Paramacrobiotus metropolitanus]
MDFDNVTLNDLGYEVYNYTETYNFTADTCEKLLRALAEWNISVEDFVAQKADYIDEDNCHRPLKNVTLISEHPIKYAYIAIYPTLLALCTIGNLLTIAILRKQNGRRNKRWSADVYLVALAISDICAVWGQLVYFSSTIDAAIADPYYKSFLSGASGGIAFFADVFINFSDWILISFTVERLLAVVLPLQYGRLVSRKRTFFTVCCLFVLAVLAVVYNLYDYYYFYFWDDPRCPSTFLPFPVVLKNWRSAQKYFTIIVPVLNFAIILTLNSIVAVCLCRQRRFRTLYVHSSATNPDVDAGKDGAAIQMLLTVALFYIVTQSPKVVFNLWIAVSASPLCYTPPTENQHAILLRLSDIIFIANYSCNFLLYYGVSSAFRKGCRQLWQSQPFRRLDGRSGATTPTGHPGAYDTQRGVMSGLEAIQPVQKRSLESFSSSKTMSSTVMPLSEKSSNGSSSTGK